MDYQATFRFSQEIDFRILSHDLIFRKPARTSRDTLYRRRIFYVGIYYRDQPSVTGWGECAPIYGLSPEKENTVLYELEESLRLIRNTREVLFSQLPRPAIRFAIETAVADLIYGGRRRINEIGTFSAVPINGLVWMNGIETMMREAEQKAEEGFTTVKFKVGALRIEDELEMLAAFRKKYAADRVTVRLDANGAFKEEDVFLKLDALSRFDIHSIEQPVSAGDGELMKKVIAEKIIPVALDEQLIGVTGTDAGALLDELKPDFIVLKPMLHGGMSGCDHWIRLARERKIQWWATSMLESNIGLNAIAQWIQKYAPEMPQGLGTGGLYENNPAPNWIVRNGMLVFDENEPLLKETLSW